MRCPFDRTVGVDDPITLGRYDTEGLQPGEFSSNKNSCGALRSRRQSATMIRTGKRLKEVLKLGHNSRLRDPGSADAKEPRYPNDIKASVWLR